MTSHVYIMTNRPRGVLYIGVTSNLQKRIYIHQNNVCKPGFTKRYNLNLLVFAEEFPTSIEAIEREKQLKRWKREWKINLIEEQNPEWKDYSSNLF